jgi:hypothetical protein
MVRSATMWTILLACLFGAGPAIVWLSPRIVGGDGGPGWTYLASDSMGLGLLVLVATLFVACVIGLATSRLLGMRAGLGAIGMTLVAPALQGGEIVEILRWADAPGIFVRLALEGAIIAAFGFGVAVLMGRIAPREAPMSPAERQERTRSHITEGAIGAVSALALGAIAAWIIAREPIKGQMLAAGFAAGVVGMGAGRVIAPRSPIAPVALGVLLLGVVGPLLGFVVAGSDALRAAYEQRLPAIVGPTPIDWITGAMLGMPVGLTWAISMLEKRVEKVAQAAPV